MIISYENDQLRICCTSQERAEADLGEMSARALMTLISDAETFDTAAEFIEFYGEEALANGASLSVRVGSGYRAIFVPVEIDHDGKNIDWQSVDCLKIMDLSHVKR